MKIGGIRSVVGNYLVRRKAGDTRLTQILEFEITRQWGIWPDRTKNPLTRNPRRYWSQTDEDGILEEIFQRIGVQEGTFIEIGCGNGLQNNTVALLARGWKGGWVDANDLAFEVPKNSSNLNFSKTWVTLENVSSLVQNHLDHFKISEFDLLSLDLDGNDYHLLQNILENNHFPKVIVLEYNARFAPNARWIMPFNEHHQWVSDDYFGASLLSFTELLESRYTLVACSVQGSNAFYVSKKFEAEFEDINKDIELIYQPPFYNLVHQWGAKASAKVVETLLK